MKLRLAHYNQLLSYMAAAEREGSYYAPKEQYYKREKEIMLWILEQIQQLSKGAKQ